MTPEDDMSSVPYPCSRCGLAVTYGPAAPEGGLLCSQCAAIQATVGEDDMSEPLTDEELRQAEDRARAFPLELPAHYTYAGWRAKGTEDVMRLVAEVRRLRSDEWLEKAAEEGFNTSAPDVDDPKTEIERLVVILRKHRDGKA